MLTTVILEGPLGKAFGRKWEFAINSPKEALSMVNANKPGVFAWIKNNLPKYSRYKVLCEYEGGRKDELDIDSYVLEGKLKTVRFVPLVAGAGGGIGKIIFGVILIAAAVFIPGAQALMGPGIGMVVGGIVEMLSPRPKGDIGNQQGANVASSYFDGPANTTMQGAPVQLAYGTVMVGSQAVSAALSINQLMQS